MQSSPERIDYTLVFDLPDSFLRPSRSIALLADSKEHRGLRSRLGRRCEGWPVAGIVQATPLRRSRPNRCPIAGSGERQVQSQKPTVTDDHSIALFSAAESEAHDGSASACRLKQMKASACYRGIRGPGSAGRHSPPQSVCGHMAAALPSPISGTDDARDKRFDRRAVCWMDVVHFGVGDSFVPVCGIQPGENPGDPFGLETQRDMHAGGGRLSTGQGRRRRVAMPTAR